MRIATRLRLARQEAGITQQELALLVGVTRGAIANWEAATALPTASNMQRVACITGVSFEWLSTGRGARRIEVPLEPVPAANAEFIEDELELRLVRAFRLAAREQRHSLVELVEVKATGLAAFKA